MPIERKKSAVRSMAFRAVVMASSSADKPQTRTPYCAKRVAVASVNVHRIQCGVIMANPVPCVMS